MKKMITEIKKIKKIVKFILIIVIVLSINTLKIENSIKNEKVVIEQEEQVNNINQLPPPDFTKEQLEELAYLEEIPMD